MKGKVQWAQTPKENKREKKVTRAHAARECGSRAALQSCDGRDARGAVAGVALGRLLQALNVIHRQDFQPCRLVLAVVHARRFATACHAALSVAAARRRAAFAEQLLEDGAVERPARHRARGHDGCGALRVSREQAKLT